MVAQSRKVAVKQSLWLPVLVVSGAMLQFWLYIEYERELFSGMTDRGVGLSTYLLVLLAPIWAGVVCYSRCIKKRYLGFQQNGLFDGLSFHKLGFVPWADVDAVTISRGFLFGKVVIGLKRDSTHAQLLRKRSKARQEGLERIELPGLSVSREQHLSMVSIWNKAKVSATSQERKGGPNRTLASL